MIAAFSTWIPAPRTALKRALQIAAVLYLAAVFYTRYGGGKVEVTLRIEPQLVGNISPKATLYVVARRPRDQGGIPLAVRKYTQPFSFPIKLTLTSSDMLVPNSRLEGMVAVNARIAQDGAAVPAMPGDIEGTPFPLVVEVEKNPGVVIDLDYLRPLKRPFEREEEPPPSPKAPPAAKLVTPGSGPGPGPVVTDTAPAPQPNPAPQTSGANQIHVE